jgi:hypothetical protein
MQKEKSSFQLTRIQEKFFNFCIKILILFCWQFLMHSGKRHKCYWPNWARWRHCMPVGHIQHKIAFTFYRVAFDIRYVCLTPPMNLEIIWVSQSLRFFFFFFFKWDLSLYLNTTANIPCWHWEPPNPHKGPCVLQKLKKTELTLNPQPTKGWEIFVVWT